MTGDTTTVAVPPGTATPRGAGTGLGRLVLVVVLILLPPLVTLGWLLLARWSLPSDGTVTGQSTLAWTGGTIMIDEMYRTPSSLRAGDRVAAVDGVAVAELAVHPHRVQPQAGQTLTYTVLRADPDETRDDAAASGVAARLDVPVHLERYPVGRGLARHLPLFPVAVTMYAVATFVVIRRPRQPAARALYALATVLPLTVTSFPLSPQVIEVVSGGLWPSIVGDLANCLAWGALLHFALVFPDPLPVVTRHRGLVPVAYLLPFGYHLARLAVTPPMADPLAGLRSLIETSQPAAHIQPFLVAAAMVAGYRAARDDLARRRMRWAFLTIAIATVGYLALGQVPASLWGSPVIPWDWQGVLFAPFPLALGIAVLRYRLFDIEIIMRRSLVFGALTASLAGLYLLVVTALGRFEALPSTAAPFIASLAVAGLFGPLRTQARRLVSRSLFGDRDDPYEVMNRLSRRLEATASADSVLTTLVETLADTLRLSYAAIRLRGPAGSPARDDAAPLGDPLGAQVAHGVRTGASVKVPIVHAGEQVGELEIDAGLHREPFGVADQRLLDGLARQVGVISQNLMLEKRLRQSLERVVTAREEERRRLRRDLHDGLGPSLAAAGLQVDLAASLVETDPQRAREILTGLGVAHREAVAGLRRLVDGLRPSVLDRLGLVGALREGADSFTVHDTDTDTDTDADGETGGAETGDTEAWLTVGVQAGDIGSLPAAVEVAAYRIAQEALANAARHSGARRCEVRLWRDASALLLQIEDDGRGLEPGYRAGVGLSAIRERAGELGGSATITGGARGGTLVFARLPVRADA